jgi:FAD:protein FMN transferase
LRRLLEGYNASMADDKPTSRRDFLRGRSMGRALLAAANELADRAEGALGVGTSADARLPEPTEFIAKTARMQVTRRAMACDFVIEHHAADGSHVSDSVLEALDLIERLEDQLSIYREHTEVANLNRSAAMREVEVEPGLFSLIQTCLQLHAKTGGAFDFTSGPLSRAWGFLQRAGRVPEAEELAAAMDVVGAQLVQINDARFSVNFAKPGVEINFNSIGKGYALDRAAAQMSLAGLKDFLCHGGRSSVLARGCERTGRYNGWGVAVPHPLKPEGQVGEIQLVDNALGTSGSGTQFFEHAGRRFGHLIDPRTGQPTEGVYTATAVADTAAEADALATAFYIMGPGDTSEYCAAHSDVGAVLVCRGEGASGIDVHAFNMEGRWIADRL